MMRPHGEARPPGGHARVLRALGALALIVGLALGGCRPAPTPAPAPGAVPRVAVTLSFAPLVLKWAQAYLEERGPLPFDVEVVHAGVAIAGVKAGDYEVAVGALEPEDDWFATPLADDPIAVVTGGGDGLRDITSDALVELLSGRVADWSALAGSTLPVQPVIPLPEDDLRHLIDRRLMGGTPFASGSRLAAAPSQALALLKGDPGAFALLPLSALPEEASPLRLDGALPREGGGPDSGYGLVAEVLAIAIDEPDGPVRDWLAWIQAHRSPYAGGASGQP